MAFYDLQYFFCFKAGFKRWLSCTKKIASGVNPNIPKSLDCIGSATLLSIACNCHTYTGNAQ